MRLRRVRRGSPSPLPWPYQQALLLTEYEGLTQKELAQRLGLSFSGAKSRVQRARDQLRELLLECCHFEFDRRGTIIAYYPNCERCATEACDADSHECAHDDEGLMSTSATSVELSRSRRDLLPMTASRTSTSIPVSSTQEDAAITERVRERYAQAANRVLNAEGDSGCCSTSTLASGCCAAVDADCGAVSAGLYTRDEVASLPEDAVLAGRREMANWPAPLCVPPNR
jgi:transcriptional regulator with XRE-family HTH domain